LGWSGNPRFCLDLVYAGHVLLCVTPEVWQEYVEKIPVVFASQKRPVNAAVELARLLKVAQFVDAAPLGKRRSRDIKDDRYLSAALGAGARDIVTNDRDLLVLGQPFGVAISTPIQFIKRVRAAEFI
jgi:predicted nucleic acid-binding protein